MRQAAGDEIFIPRPCRASCHPSLVTRHPTAFTLVELLVVIAIAGIIAGLAIPALKNLGKSNVNLSASRQLLDDIGHARQLAMSRRTTVYMVFVPTNFWTIPGSFPNAWFNSLTLAAQTAVTNLVDKQLTGYTFVADGALGDQPGNHQWHYLATWQNLPDGTFIDAQKFSAPGTVINDSVTDKVFNQWDADYSHSDFNRMYAFTNLAFPFPTETNTAMMVALPYIAFNYLGQLTTDGVNLSTHDEYIPLAHGSVNYGYDANKVPQLSEVTPGDIAEVPPGNSTDISYNIIHIDALTGRATLEYHKVQ